MKYITQNSIFDYQIIDSVNCNPVQAPMCFAAAASNQQVQKYPTIHIRAFRSFADLYCTTLICILKIRYYSVDSSA